MGGEGKVAFPTCLEHFCMSTIESAVSMRSLYFSLEGGKIRKGGRIHGKVHCIIENSPDHLP